MGLIQSMLLRKVMTALDMDCVGPCWTEVVFHKLFHCVEKSLVCAADWSGRREMMW